MPHENLHRPLDSDHEAECFQKHHEHDIRLTIMETKVGSVESSLATIITKHEGTNTTLDRLATLFEQFMKTFETHSINLEKTRSFQTRVETIWKVVATGAIVLVVVIGAIYTIGKDSGVLPTHPTSATAPK